MYLDIYIIVNMSMDVLMIWLTGRLFGRRLHVCRAALSAAVGTAWAVGTVLMGVRQELLLLFPGLVVIAPLMMWIAFLPDSFAELIRLTAGLWGSVAFVGGALYLLSEHLSVHSVAGYLSMDISWIRLVLWVAGVVSVFWGIVRVLRSGRYRKYLYVVTLYYHGKEQKLTAFLDTGNQLYEPYGHQPVHVASWQSCGWMCDLSAGVLLVPFSSVGKEQGMLPCIQFDEMKIEQNEKVWEIKMKPWVALCKSPLSKTGEYQMLLHE